MKQLFGQYIKTLRVEKGFTLTQLGAKLGIDSANLSKIENNKRDFDEKKLESLAKAFELNPENLKTEFFGEYFAKKIYSSNCSTNAFTVAEEKVKYLRQLDVKQSKLKL
ncbi:MAG: helix-turn-helix transcriptional regulator [Urechidicola sp.]|nr:helix-turn-helix transcriptional regulator [Urechidicola sp.]